MALVLSKGIIMNEWKDAVLDALAVHALDADVSMSPHSILAKILEANTAFAQMSSANLIGEQQLELCRLRDEIDRQKDLMSKANKLLEDAVDTLSKGRFW